MDFLVIAMDGTDESALDRRMAVRPDHLAGLGKMKEQGHLVSGGGILDDNGKQIGIWYSSKQWTTVIIEENNEIAILAPEPPGFGGGN